MELRLRRSTASGSVNEMFRRFLEFEPHARLSSGLLEGASTPQFESELAALEAEAREDLEDRASQLAPLSAELRQLVARHDPTQLIPSISVPAGMGVFEQEADDDSLRTFSNDAKIEYIAGLALVGPPGTEDVDASTTRRAVALTSAVFDAAIAYVVIQPSSDPPSRHLGRDSASRLLRAEYIYDRMTGYPVHLQEIGDEVFEPHRNFYREELGFCPSDATRLVRGYNAWLSSECHEAIVAHDPMSEHIDEAAYMESSARVRAALDAICLWTPELLASHTVVPMGEIAAMLRAMSVEFGCQPAFRTPLDDNQARTNPLIRVADDSYLAPVSWLLAHHVHDWLRRYIRDNPTSRVGKRYPKHRSDAAERLVNRSLQAVFGKQAVFGNQHYNGNTVSGEIDCLVSGATPTVVEVKSRMLTEQGRRGLRSRVESVAKDVIVKSFEQTSRARDYITLEGGRCFADQQGSQPRRVLSDDVTDVVEVVVTLEHMDPIATFASTLAGSDQTRRIWVTKLADLLMVRDILGDPASFLHYAHSRGQTSKLGVLVLMESDALGEYLYDRLSSLIGRATESRDEPTETLLYYNSSAINQFFLMSEAGVAQEKPTTGVPPAITKALTTCASGYSSAWATLATAVMTAPIVTWKKWHRSVRRHRGEHPFLLPCGTASIVVSASLADAELRDGCTPILAVPRRELRVRRAHADKPARLPRQGGQ